MHYFRLMGWQHVVLAVFPALVLVILLYLALAGVHLRPHRADEEKKTAVHRYAGEIEAQDAPFPLILILIIAGFLLWVFFYVLGNGLLGVKI